MDTEFQKRYEQVRRYRASDDMHRHRVSNYADAFKAQREMQGYDIAGKQAAGEYLGSVVGGGVRDAAESVRSKVAPGTPSLPEVPMTGRGLMEEIPRSLVQFMTIYGPARAALGGSFLGEMAAGAGADFLAFKNKEGTLSDLAIDLGIKNDVTAFLSGRMSDTEFEASLKASLEGAAIGAMVALPAGIRKAFLWVRDNPQIKARILDFLGAAPTRGKAAGVVSVGAVATEPVEVKKERPRDEKGRFVKVGNGENP